MKKVLVLLFILVFNVYICFADIMIDDNAQKASLTFLNNLVAKNQLAEKVNKDIHRDYSFIKQFKAAYKINPNSVKSKKNLEFGLACVQRNKAYLEEFKNNYFVPAYNEYKRVENPKQMMSYEYWFYTTPMSEISAFYDFYRMVEANLEDCQFIYDKSK